MFGCHAGSGEAWRLGSGSGAGAGADTSADGIQQQQQQQQGVGRRERFSQDVRVTPG